MRPTSLVRRPECWLLLLAASAFVGCIAMPVRVPLRVQGPAAETLRFDPGFLAQPATSRADVQQRFSWMWVASDEPHLFCGHYRMSQWRLAGAQAEPVIGALPYTERLWGGRTVFVEFDDGGRITRHVIGDDGALASLVWEWSRRPANRLPLSETILLTGLRHSHNWSGGGDGAGLELARDHISFEDANGHHNFVVAPAEVERLEYASGNINNPNDGSIVYTLRFHHRTPAGNKLTLIMDPRSFFTLVRYLAVAAPAMRLAHGHEIKDAR